MNLTINKYSNRNNKTGFGKRVYGVSGKEIRKISDKINGNDLMTHITKLCSPEMEGRGVGQAGIEKAKEYILEEIKKIGLEPVESLNKNSFLQKLIMETYSTLSEKVKKNFIGSISYKNDFPSMGPIPDATETYNILGMIKGRKRPEDYIILTAHYDHLGKDLKSGIIYPGADDNASSVSTLLEIAKAMKRNKGNKKSIIFAFLTGEEKYHCGADKLASELKNKNIQKVQILNIEMLGSARQSNILDIWKASNTLSKDLILTIQKTAEIFKFKTKVHLQDPGSDAKVFARANIPTTCVAFDFYSKQTHKFYHSSEDTPDKINIEAYQQVSKFISGISYTLANQKGLNVVEKLKMFLKHFTTKST